MYITIAYYNHSLTTPINIYTGMHCHNVLGFKPISIYKLITRVLCTFDDKCQLSEGTFSFFTQKMKKIFLQDNYCKEQLMDNLYTLIEQSLVYA